MTLNVSIGSAQALNGREAGLQAAHQALNKLGTAAASFGFIIASHQYQAREVISGVSGLLGDTPLIGFSSPAGQEPMPLAVCAPPASATRRWRG